MHLRCACNRTASSKSARAPLSCTNRHTSECDSLRIQECSVETRGRRPQETGNTVSKLLARTVNDTQNTLSQRTSPAYALSRARLFRSSARVGEGAVDRGGGGAAAGLGAFPEPACAFLYFSPSPKEGENKQSRTRRGRRNDGARIFQERGNRESLCYNCSRVTECRSGKAEVSSGTARGHAKTRAGTGSGAPRKQLPRMSHSTSIKRTNVCATRHTTHL